MTSTTAVQSITRASFDSTLTNLHADIAAPVLAIGDGNGVEFDRALRNARFWPTPWVLQQRTDDGAGVLAAVNVTRSIGDEAEVRLFIPGTSGGWQDNSITVNVTEMRGNRWFAVDVDAAAAMVADIDRAAIAASDSTIIPRTAESAHQRSRIIRLYAPESPTARVLDRLAKWLPGGEMNTRGHEFAADIDLCGEYEAAVCPTMGWLPRRGSGNSRAALCALWETAMAEIEAEYSDDPAAALNAAIGRYDRDGMVNLAIVEHADAHLESFKRPRVNDLLAELGMSPIPTARTYSVEVRVERTRQVTEYATVTVEVEAEDDDAAARLAEDAATDELDYADWIVEDDHYDSDITDVEVEDVTVM